jgi:hypothetical protein
MLTKSAFAATLVLAAALPARGEPQDRGASAPERHGVPHTPILVLAPDPLGDILNARGPEPHAGAFARFAAYAAIGNSDGAQIISGQLRAFGVAQDRLRDLADRAELHTGSTPCPVRTD